MFSILVPILALLACGESTQIKDVIVPVASKTPSVEPVYPTSDVTVALGDGTVARYKVREQLARQNLPNDAIGETSDVFGWIIFEPDGTIRSEDSVVTIDLKSLSSDKAKRDSYVRNNTLQTDEFPNAVFVARKTLNLPWPLPRGGETTFRLIGDMTVHGITKELIWEVKASFIDQSVTGTAKTSFPFEKFGLTQPNVLFLIGVDNEIRLELDIVASAGAE